MSKTNQTGHTPGLMDAGGGGGRGRPSFMARVHCFADWIAVIKSSCCCLQLFFLTGWDYKQTNKQKHILASIIIFFFFCSWDLNLQKTELWDLEREAEFVFISIKTGLENTVIKSTNHSSEGKHKIIRKTT